MNQSAPPQVPTDDAEHAPPLQNPPEESGEATGFEIKTPRENNTELFSFNAFLISLASSGLANLGFPLPNGETQEIDLVLAQQTIDILVMLESKTRGNLTVDERKLLDTLIYDLHVYFIQVAKTMNAG